MHTVNVYPHISRIENWSSKIRQNVPNGFRFCFVVSVNTNICKFCRTKFGLTFSIFYGSILPSLSLFLLFLFLFLHVSPSSASYIFHSPTSPISCDTLTLNRSILFLVSHVSLIPLTLNSLLSVLCNLHLPNHRKLHSCNFPFYWSSDVFIHCTSCRSNLTS